IHRQGNQHFSAASHTGSIDRWRMCMTSDPGAGSYRNYQQLPESPESEVETVDGVTHTDTTRTFDCSFDGVSPSGKAQGFDPCIRWFESSHPSHFLLLLLLLLLLLVITNYY